MRTANEKPELDQAREYPPFWERAVPWLVLLISLIVVVLLVIAFLVLFGIFPGSG